MNQLKAKEFLYNNPYKLGHMLGYDKLNETHNEWILYCWLAKGDITLQAYRNSKKTTSILVVGIIWYLMFYPDTTIAIIRKSESGAIKILSEIVKHYEGERLKYIYDKYFDYDFRAVDYSQKRLDIPNKSKITKESSIEVFGKGGNITGSHFDILCIDDIVTEKDRYSKAERESTKNYIKELDNIKTITGKKIITGTPWHIDDAFKILPIAKRYPLGSIEDPDFTPEKIKELQMTQGTSLFACNYLLKHIADEDRLFSDIQFKRWNSNIPCYAYCDPAYSGKNTTALTLLQKEDGHYIVKGFAWRQNITELYEKISNICELNQCLNLYIEANADHGLSYKEFVKLFPLCSSVNEKENKHYKILFYIRKIYDIIYFDEDCQAEYLEQISYYEEGNEPDDAPDSLASLIRERKIINGGQSIVESIKVEDIDEEFKW